MKVYLLQVNQEEVSIGSKCTYYRSTRKRSVESKCTYYRSTRKRSVEFSVYDKHIGFSVWYCVSILTHVLALKGGGAGGRHYSLLHR